MQRFRSASRRRSEARGHFCKYRKRTVYGTATPYLILTIYLYGPHYDRAVCVYGSLCLYGTVTPYLLLTVSHAHRYHAPIRSCRILRYHICIIPYLVRAACSWAVCTVLYQGFCLLGQSSVLIVSRAPFGVLYTIPPPYSMSDRVRYRTVLIHIARLSSRSTCQRG